MGLKLYNFFRNSAGHRVRIALHLKGLDFDYVSVDIRPASDTRAALHYSDVNPLGLIPALDHDGTIITQSIAIIDYRERVFPSPSLFPASPGTRAQALAFALTIASEIHPLNNTRVHRFFNEELKLSPDQRDRWFREWNARGCAALEAMLAARPASPFCFGGAPSVADIALVPQYYNLRRAGFDLSPYPRLGAVVAHCEALPAFRKAAPEARPDYVDGQ